MRRARALAAGMDLERSAPRVDAPISEIVISGSDEKFKLYLEEHCTAVLPCDGASGSCSRTIGSVGLLLLVSWLPSNVEAYLSRSSVLMSPGLLNALLPVRSPLDDG